MAKRLTTNAQVVVTMNGKQANEQMKKLKEESARLEKQLDKAKKSGDKLLFDKTKKSLQEVQSQMKLFETNVSKVEDVMRRLDKATPKELKSTLSTLRRQLDGMERGSQLWARQVRMIKQVEAELRKVNTALATQESHWTRMNKWLNDTQTFLMGAAAAVTGLVMAGRKAVSAFADMDEQLANTRKFTGMTEKQVNELNSAFKSIDTRIARDQLNLLAQEGGRLGKNAIEDVQGYVEAAQVINVALVDLGEGATQTIAKIANIFGVEQQLGIKQSMLAIGSAVNVLSQNCTASKPYLVEFAQRMAGIGAQAGLTVPQILAFAAVLDANGQKVEMSATAFQKVIMNLANKNQEFAKTLGLDADVLAKTLQRSAKDGIMMYLEAIKKLSDQTSANNATVALAPLFKDMGMDAARVASVLSTLANHIDEVKWQLGNADKAFREATSATREFNIFNNTAQASIDKAKNRVHELAIELGENLYPLMKHIYTSSSLLIRGLNVLIKFLIEHKGAIVTLTASIAAYSVAANLAKMRTKALAAAQSLSAARGKIWQAALLLMNAGLYMLHGRLGRATLMMRQFNAVTKVNPLGILVTALTAVGTALIMTARKATEFRRSLDEAIKPVTGFAEETHKEVKELDQLFGVLSGAEKGTKAYEKAKESLMSKYGVYLRWLINEKGEITNLSEAYDQLAYAATKSAQARSLASAKDRLDDTYFGKVDDLTEKLRDALSRTGMPDRDVTRIVTRTSQSLALGKGVPSDIYKEVLDYQSGHMGMWQTITGESPLRVLQELTSNKREYSTRKTKLDSIDNEFFSKVDTMELDRIIATLNNHMRHLDPNKAKQYKMEESSSIDVDISVLDPEKAAKLIELIGSGTVYPVKRLSLDKSGSKSLIPSGDSPSVLDVKTDKGTKTGLTYDGLAPSATYGKVVGKVDLHQAETLLRELKWERSRREESDKKGQRSKGAGDFTPYVSDKDQAMADRKAAAEARAAAAKARKEFKDGLARIRASFESGESSLISDYESGTVDYPSYLKKRSDLEQGYYADSLAYYREHLSEIRDLDVAEDKDYQVLMNKKVEAFARYNDLRIEYESERIRREAQFAKSQASQDFKVLSSPGPDEERAYIERVLAIESEALRRERDLHAKGSREWERLQLQLEQKSADARMDVERMYQERLQKVRSEYSELKARDKYLVEKAVLDELLKAEKLGLEEYDRLLEGLMKKYGADIESRDPKSEGALQKLRSIGNEWVTLAVNIGESFNNLWTEFLKNGKFSLDSIADVAEKTFAIVTSGMKMSSAFAQANSEIEIKRIEKRYDREIELAQGNRYLVTKLEKEKEEEIASEKSKASESQYQMMMIQAIADAIVGSMKAYNAAMGLGPVGIALAPVLAGVALAAGMANVALLKKQQEAASATGYAEGGFTRPGGKYDVAGVVHAGEWVASAELVSNPVTRPMINLLEAAQRGNVVGRVPSVAGGVGGAAVPESSEGVGALLSDVRETLEQLRVRLDEPLVAVAQIAGKNGIRRKLDEYDKLIRN